VIEALRAFAPGLPAHVTAEGRYADAPTAADRLRVGDRVEVATSTTEATGTYEIEADGTIPLRRIGHIALRGLDATGGAPDVQKRVDAAPGQLPGTKIERVTRVASRAPSIFVAGRVSSSGEVPAGTTTIDAAITWGGRATGADPAAAWVWREKPTGFVKVTRAELLDGALVDGDVVVVPAAGNDTRSP
jgi:protein involved in polysaccharide export with SLBB domain